ncbi:hypothetical protein D3C81_1702360 [compost metagenome]
MTDVQQLIDFRIKQRLTFYMKINVVRMRLNIVQYFDKVLNLDKLRFSMSWRTKAASQIANTRCFNIKFLELFHLMPAYFFRYLIHDIN